MSGLPKSIDIHEQGPREGFQIEGVHTDDKIRLIATLAETMAESIVGHGQPSELLHAGGLNAFRRKAALDGTA
jgi:hypothetical protein